jgi:hypothetical protein
MDPQPRPQSGAAFGLSGAAPGDRQFDPTTQKAVWPSTGNYCRGGAYDSALLACNSIAILTRGHERERFEWLSKIAGEVIATPGSESNSKRIFDKCWVTAQFREDLMIFNQSKNWQLPVALRSHRACHAGSSGKGTRSER